MSNSLIRTTSTVLHVGQGPQEPSRSDQSNGSGDQSEQILRLRDIGLTYGNQGSASRCVLAGIDLAVSRREIVCLVGQSGCGKTTLLNIIAGR